MSIDETMNLIGHIKCVSAEDAGDGTMKVVFDYDKKFIKEYKRLFNLKRFSKKHFEEQLSKAIEYFAKQVETDKGFLDLKQEILDLKED